MSMNTHYLHVSPKSFRRSLKRRLVTKFLNKALQAIRWFYMIDTAKKLGYSGASTNETISGYTKRYATKLRANSGGRRQGDGTLDEGVRSEAERAEGQGEDQAQGEIDQFLPDGGGINRMPPTMPSSRFMRPAMTRQWRPQNSLIGLFVKSPDL